MLTALYPDVWNPKQQQQNRGGRVFLLRAICLISGELPFLF